MSLVVFGFADLFRPNKDHPNYLHMSWACTAALVALATFSITFNIPWYWGGIVMIAYLVWTFSTPSGLLNPNARQWPVLVVALIVGAIMLTGKLAPQPSQQIKDFYKDWAPAQLESIDLVLALLILGSVLICVNTANIIVRMVLPIADREVLDSTHMRGGQIIGPIERVFILGMAATGQFAAIGLLIAAKGIVRFPELSRDDKNAEYFLIGSLVSWAVALVLALLIS